MKKVILFCAVILSIKSNAQTIDVSSIQQTTELSPRKIITVKPSPRENSGPLQRLTCVHSDGAWDGNCYHIFVSCTNGTGLNITIFVENCYDAIVLSASDLSNGQKSKLLDVTVKYDVTSIPNETDNVALQQYKNGTYEVMQDAIYTGTEGTVIIKAGIYNINNSKLHTIMSVN